MDNSAYKIHLNGVKNNLISQYYDLLVDSCKGSQNGLDSGVPKEEVVSKIKEDLKNKLNNVYQKLVNELEKNNFYLVEVDCRGCKYLRISNKYYSKSYLCHANEKEVYLIGTPSFNTNIDIIPEPHINCVFNKFRRREDIIAKCNNWKNYDYVKTIQEAIEADKESGGTFNVKENKPVTDLFNIPKKGLLFVAENIFHGRSSFYIYKFHRRYMGKIYRLDNCNGFSSKDRAINKILSFYG